ncbi:peptidase MA family metallohydrolase [Anaerosalibacter massiliensis]|uniref:Peptidase MA-like domain-containing protein n=1 Tax=Anaerosalibacter massiliensis TaxID=1347392 RepID=A0A9X2MJU5_9FIRM|nr:hypothetical protein [Anaerosalibacter massiliensis]MCR2044816.1 hypothetical protein [Anaerosalibacter massiliensis]
MKKLIAITSIVFIILLLIITFKSFFIVSTYPSYKRIEKGRVLQRTNKYYTLNGTHFSIRYKEADKNIAFITLNKLERHYEEICNKLDYFPKEKIPVIIYNNGEEFLKTIRLKTNSLPLGVYYSGTINILSPYNWVEDKYDIEKVYEETGPHIHEFIHFIVDEKTNGNYPMWLTEGMALYMEREILGIDWELGKEKSKSIGIEELNNDFDKIEVDISYRKSLETVDSLIDKYGLDKINLLLDDLGKGNNINTSVKKALKVNFKDIN